MVSTAKLTKDTEEVVHQSAPIPKSAVVVSREEWSDLPLEVIEGVLPSDLKGHVFIMGPVGAIHPQNEKEVYPGSAGSSLFNGDGMIYRLDFAGEVAPSLTSRLIKTPCFLQIKQPYPGVALVI